jgi:ER-bound oxygenase mpaB/B'/Rubber oxygenase, catalytic domain
MSRYTVRNEIEQLDPIRDHQRIIFLSARVDFPFDTTRALEFALFRTFCSPPISQILDETGEFQNRTAKRYEDTDILISEIVERGYNSEEGRKAIRRMNQLHGRFQIANEDFLYVLSTFIFEPIRWNAKFGWRPLIEKEKLGYFYFWREVGERMGIREIPEEYAAYEKFNVDYEAGNFCFTEANQRVGAATRELFVSWFPRIFGPIVRGSIYSLLDKPLMKAFAFPKPNPILAAMVVSSLKMRAATLRWLPARQKPFLRTKMRRPLYPNGYDLDAIGPPGTQLSERTAPQI